MNAENAGGGSFRHFFIKQGFYFRFFASVFLPLRRLRTLATTRYNRAVAMMLFGFLLTG
jgi:hypothetical protein